MSAKGMRQPVTAICDPLILLHGIVADEAAYKSREARIRISPDPDVVSMLASASFIFEKLTSYPLLPVGLKPALGVSFLKFFSTTLLKLQQSEFVAFDLAQRIPEKERDKVNKISEFIKKVNKTSEEINRMTNGNYGGTDFGLHQNLVLSRFAKLPLLTTVEPVRLPIVSQMSNQGNVRQRIEVLHEVFAIELPNFSISTLDELLEIRQAKGARDFRDFFRSFYATIEDEIQNPLSESAREKISRSWLRLRNEGIDLIVDDLQKEITGWQVITAGVSIVLDVLGFIPGVSLVTGTISTGKDAKHLIDLVMKQRRAKEFGWLCFLSDLRRGKSRT